MLSLPEGDIRSQTSRLRHHHRRDIHADRGNTLIMDIAGYLALAAAEIANGQLATVD
jgi:hypothetical protein